MGPLPIKRGVKNGAGNHWISGKEKKVFLSFEKKWRGRNRSRQDVSIKWQKTPLHSSPFPVANKMPPAERNIIRVFFPLVVARVSYRGETGVSAGDLKNSKNPPLRSTHDAKDSAFFAPAMKREGERLLLVGDFGRRRKGTLPSQPWLE